MELKCKILGHTWVTGLFYRVFHIEPQIVQLYCGRCQKWIDVDIKTFKRYFTKESQKYVAEQRAHEQYEEEYYAE